MLSTFLAVVRRDLMLAFRQRMDVMNTLVFFVVVVTIVPLGVGADPNLLRAIAPGVVWVAALLAAVLSLQRLFASDYQDGTLEQMLLAGEPLAVIVLGKVVAHWLVTGIPVTVISILLALMFDIDADAAMTLCLSLAAGTPVLSFLGAVGASLTLSLRGAGVLISLLVLPLYIPVLILGAGAAEAVASGLDGTPYLLLLAALSLLAMVLTPWAIAAALRISVE
ncbi:MAG: Heme exporter protein B [Gammaproteobacteria bacterium]|nr:Heme exporter protein B [Gammaproteobacteria bacterium]